jgi:hypothetical protein
MDMARRAIELLRCALSDAPPELVPASDAAAMVALYAEVERMGAAGKALYARRVEETAAFVASGHRNAASWLADVAGEPVGAALGLLEAARLMESGPAAVREAFCAGRLSVAQAKEVARAGVHDDTTASELLRSAEEEPFRDLRARAARARRCARGEEGEVAREARAHAGRYLRTFEPEEGGLRIDAWLTKLDAAAVLTRIEAVTDTVFEEARKHGDHQPRDRYRADALVRICEHGGTAKGSATGSGPRARLLVRVDAAALSRGHTQGDEVCEIPGVGPVPVAQARDLMGDAVFNVVVTKGIDIVCVTSTKRTIRWAMRVALTERDPICVVPGCSASQHLEIDHWGTDYHKGGPTELANLARLCRPHHRQRTHGGWQLLGGPGAWRWIPPPGADPPDPPGSTGSTGST